MKIIVLQWRNVWFHCFWRSPLAKRSAWTAISNDFVRSGVFVIFQTCMWRHKKKNTKRHMFKVLAKTYVFTRAATSTCLKKTQKNKFFMFLEFGTNAIKSHRFGVGLAPRQELQDIVRNWFWPVVGHFLRFNSALKSCMKHLGSTGTCVGSLVGWLRWTHTFWRDWDSVFLD